MGSGGRAVADPGGRSVRRGRRPGEEARVDIDFNSSPGPSLGVEVELEIVDRETGRAGQRGQLDPGRDRRPATPRASTPRPSTSCSSAPSRSSPACAPRWPRPGPTCRRPSTRWPPRPTARGLDLDVLGHPPVLAAGRTRRSAPTPGTPSSSRRCSGWPGAWPSSASTSTSASARPSQGGRHRQRPRRLHPPPPGPQRLQPLLGGPRHRPVVVSEQGVRGPAHRRAPGPASRAGRSSSS